MDSMMHRQTGEGTFPQSRDWVACRTPRFQADKIRLFCFHHAGGNESAFRPWPDLLPNWIEVCTVQLPGRHNLFSQPRRTSMAELVSDLMPGLRPWLTQPFAFFGHSLGALVSSATALRLAREGAALPRHMFVSGCRPAHVPRRHPPLAHAPDDVVIDAVRTLQPSAVDFLADPELRALFLPILRDDFAISESWRWQEGPLACPITALGGHSDPWVAGEELAGWQALTTRGFSKQMFAGDHFFIDTAREGVLRTIRDTLAATRATAHRDVTSMIA